VVSLGEEAGPLGDGPTLSLGEGLTWVPVGGAGPVVELTLPPPVGGTTLVEGTPPVVGTPPVGVPVVPTPPVGEVPP
jgi:hypothetical protein